MLTETENLQEQNSFFEIKECCHWTTVDWLCCCLVAQSCLTLSDPMDCSPPASSLHEMSSARILEWVAIFFSRGSSWPRDWTWVSYFSQFSRSVVSDSLWPHGLQHASPPCPSPTPRVYSNSCPLSQWCHPTISSSVVPFSTFCQSFPASGSFQMSQFFASDGQSIGVQRQHQSFWWIFRTDFF